MKKIVLLALASLAFGVQESEFKVYEQILNQLDTKQIPAFVVQTAKPNLPSRVDEMITLKDVSSDGLNIHGELVLNETKTKKLKGYNKASNFGFKKNEFYQNGKEGALQLRHGKSCAKSRHHAKWVAMALRAGIFLI